MGLKRVGHDLVAKHQQHFSCFMKSYECRCFKQIHQLVFLMSTVYKYIYRERERVLAHFLTPSAEGVLASLVFYMFL